MTLETSRRVLRPLRADDFEDYADMLGFSNWAVVEKESGEFAGRAGPGRR